MADFSLTPGGVYNSLSKGAEYNPVPLDSATQGLINDQATKATTTDFGGLLNKNVQAQGSAAMASQPSAAASAAKFGGAAGDPAMIQAIRNQYNKTAQKSINHIIQQNNWQAPMTQADQLHMAASSALAQQQVETQNYEGLMNAYNDNVAARAQVISSVLGMLGSGAAVAASGRRSGPSGAATENALERSTNRVPMGATNNDYTNVASYGDPYMDYGNGYGWYDNGQGAPGYFGRTS